MICFWVNLLPFILVPLWQEHQVFNDILSGVRFRAGPIQHRRDLTLVLDKTHSG